MDKSEKVPDSFYGIRGKGTKVTSCIVLEKIKGGRTCRRGSSDHCSWKSFRECISYLEDGDRTGGEQRYLGEKRG